MTLRPRPLGNRALAAFGTTIFAEMSGLAAASGAINLGQGFPDTDGPIDVLDAAVAAIRGLDVDPGGEILVTVGATEAIAATVLALCEPGDEVVTFEPYYDSYAATIALAGATRRTSVLRFPEFTVDETSLRAAFSSRTRMVLLNTPHNPTGKVFSRAELDLICALAREFDAWVVTDEVYEHLAFAGSEHIPVATLPGMAQRTLTISSAGKTFSTTGWKVGWVRGPADAIGDPRCQTIPYVCRIGPLPARCCRGVGAARFNVCRDRPVFAEQT